MKFVLSYLKRSNNACNKSNSCLYYWPFVRTWIHLHCLRTTSCILLCRRYFFFFFCEINMSGALTIVYGESYLQLISVTFCDKIATFRLKKKKWRKKQSKNQSLVTAAQKVDQFLWNSYTVIRETLLVCIQNFRSTLFTFFWYI